MNTCTLHSNARAAWRCNKCQSYLCPACAARQERQGSELVRCVQCGGLAEPLLTRRKIKSFWAMLPTFYKNMFSLSGLLQLAGLGAFLAFLGWMGTFPLTGIVALFIYLGLFATYYFLVVQKATHGEEGLPELEDFGGFGEILLNGLRFIMSFALLWVPALLYIWNSPMSYSAPGDLLTDPFLIVILVLSFFYVPGAIITTAVSESLVAILNPVNVVKIAMTMPRDYVVAAVVWGMIHGLQVLFKTLLSATLGKVGIPVLIPWLQEILTLILPFTAAFVLGRAVYQNGEKFGILGPTDLVEPEMPKAVPRGVVPAEFTRSAGHPQGPVEPIALDDDAPVVAGELVSGLILGAGVAAPSEGAQLQAALKQSVEAGDGKAAFAAYSKLQALGESTGLTAEDELKLASLMGRAGAVLQAAQLCRAVAEKEPDGPHATRAIFTAARLAVEKLERKDQGIALYRYLIEKYPDDPFSARAQEMIRQLES